MSRSSRAIASTAAAALLACAVAPTPARAALAVYDPFTAGGAAPAAGQYFSGTASSTGSNNDSLVPQAPAVLGFSSANAWSGGTFSSGVYPKVLATSLSYTGLTSSGGMVSLFRSGTASSSTKTFQRTATTSDTSPVQWVSFLLKENVDSSADTAIKLDWNTTATQTLTVGTNKTSGAAFFTSNGTAKVDGTGATNLNDNATHLYLIKLESGVVSGQPDYDQITLWIDPTLASGEAGLTGGIVGQGLVRQNAGAGVQTFKQLTVSGAANTATTNGNPTVIQFDEFRVGNAFADVTAVPEPATLALAAAAAPLLLARRRRR